MDELAETGDLLSSRELVRDTAKSVLRTIEWTVLCHQVSALIWSITLDPYEPMGKAVIALLIPIHVALLPAYIRGRGPFSRGHWWVLAALAVTLGVLTLAAMLSPPNTYGTPWFHLSYYCAGTFTLLAFYPWAPGGSRRRRALVDGLIFAFLYLYLIGLSVWNNHVLAWPQAKDAAFAMIWPLVGYALGKSVEQVSIVVTSRQLDAQHRNFTEFFDFLHSHVKAGIAAVRTELPADQATAHEHLHGLDSTISDYRVKLILATEQVSVAELISERTRPFRGPSHHIQTPRIGALTVRREIGVLLSRAVGDLLTNAIVHGSPPVRVDFDYDHHLLRLNVVDSGPGFSAHVLDDQATSLHRLRQAARALGGDLTNTDAYPHGTEMELTIPFKR